MYFQEKRRIGSEFALLVAMSGMLAACGGPSNNKGGATTDASDSNVRALWARSVVSTQTSASFDAVSADGSGNVYVAANLFGPGTLDFGNGVTSTAVSTGYDALLIKYDAVGVAQWAHAVNAGSNPSAFGSVAADASGNLYASGYVYGSPGPVDFGNGVTLTKSDTFMNAILVKYDSSGLAQWARTASDGANHSGFASVSVDATGNVYAAGYVDGTGTYNFDNGVTVTGVAIADGFSNSPDNAVLVKYDSSGAAQWAQTVTAGSPASGFGSVAVDATGNVYAAGSIAGTGTYDFGNGVTVAGTTSGGPIGGEAGGNALLVRYSSSGIAQWARAPSVGSGGSRFGSVAVDSASNAYAAGSIGDGIYDFGNSVTAAGAVKDGSFTGMAGPLYVVLTKYDALGVAQWARTVNPGGSNSYLNSVAVDSSDNVYVAGAIHSTGTYDFGSGVAVATGTQDTGYYVALVKYNSSGITQWARSSLKGGSSENIFDAVTLDSTGNLYVAGVVAGAGIVDFGNSVTLTATQIDAGSGWSPLLLKYH